MTIDEKGEFVTLPLGRLLSFAKSTLNFRKICFAIILLASLVVVFPKQVFGTPLSSNKWSISESFSNAITSLYGVNCSSDYFCIAVGVDKVGNGVSMSTSNGGATWTMGELPSSVESLNKIFCLGSTFCLAVGLSKSYSPLIISSYDRGTTWTIGSIPSQVSSLSDLNCAMSSFCMAVGNASGNVGLAIQSIDGGAKWTIDTLPSGITHLSGVSCVSSTTCDVVGYSFDGTSNIGMELNTENGGNFWKVGSVPSEVYSLSSVSCVNSSFCMAVGTEYTTYPATGIALLSVDGGANWTLDFSPSAIYNLNDVDCVSVTFCEAVGNGIASFFGSTGGAAAETTDGGNTWQLDPLTPSTSDLYGISCLTTTFCMATGSYFPFDSSSGIVVSKATTYATWQNDKLGSTLEQVTSVSCSSINFCIAFGGGNSGYISPAISTNGGSSWTVESTTQSADSIGKISCASSTFCMAVGSYTNALIQYAADMVTTNGGMSWVLTSTYSSSNQLAPLPSVTSNLADVSCAGISSCVAVGADTSGSPLAISTTNGGGSSWSIGVMPSGVTHLYGVYCASSTFCMAVGSGSGNTGLALSTTDGGLTWSIDSVPSSVSSLSNISCANSSFCVAVGSTNIGGAVAVSTSDGGANWTLDTVPSGVSSLSEISCATSTFCVAVGGTSAISTSDGGVTWVSDSLPTQVGSLSGLSCVSTTMCVSVGSGNTSVLGSLILEIGPLVSGVSPNNGPSLGGSTVDIHGSGFSGATSVNFGSSPGSNVNVVSDNEITATSPPGVGSVDIEVVGPNGSSPISSLDTYTYVSYSPISPNRVCDTRPVGIGTSSNQCNTLGNHTLSNYETLSVQVAGNGYPVPSNATSVVLNVTATNETSSGYLTVFPSGQSQPIASNLNFKASDTVANLVEVGVGSNGDISIFNFSQSADVIVDVEGYSAPTATSSGTGLMVPLFPYRVCDTRPVGSGIASNPCNTAPNKTLASGGKLDVNVSSANVPSDATAVIANITVTNTASNGYLTAWQGPSTTSPPIASNLNFGAGDTIANRVIVPLNVQTGDFTLYVFGSTADVIVDVNGYITGSSATLGTVFNPMSPTRICDSRVANGADIVANQCDTNGNTTLGPNSSEVISIPASTQVPSDATALVLNVTTTNTTTPGFLSIYPTPSNPPIASDLNWSQGETRANLVVVKLGANNTITIYNLSGSADLIIDLEGWYS
ncbi:MAG: hypothetical protein HKL80_03200 [Acidimicrobiales bacterium]|nr:hypothetical protein [Acidimicrobiales bacterium]